MNIFKNKLLKKTSAILMSTLVLGNSFSFAMNKKGKNSRASSKKVEINVSETVTIRKYLTLVINKIFDICEKLESSEEIENTADELAVFLKQNLPSIASIFRQIYIKKYGIVSFKRAQRPNDKYYNASNLIEDFLELINKIKNDNALICTYFVFNKSLSNVLSDILKDVQQVPLNEKCNSATEYISKTPVYGVVASLMTKTDIDNLCKALSEEYVLHEKVAANINSLTDDEQFNLKACLQKVLTAVMTMQYNSATLSKFLEHRHGNIFNYGANGVMDKLHKTSRHPILDNTDLDIILQAFCRVLYLYKDLKIINDDIASALNNLAVQTYAYFNADSSMLKEDECIIFDEILGIMVDTIILFQPELVVNRLGKFEVSEYKNIITKVMSKHINFHRIAFTNNMSILQACLEKFAENLSKGKYDLILKFVADKTNLSIAKNLLKRHNSDVCTYYDQFTNDISENCADTNLSDIFKFICFFKNDCQKLEKEFNEFKTVNKENIEKYATKNLQIQIGVIERDLKAIFDIISIYKCLNIYVRNDALPSNKLIDKNKVFSTTSIAIGILEPYFYKTFFEIADDIDKISMINEKLKILIKTVKNNFSYLMDVKNARIQKVNNFSKRVINVPESKNFTLSFVNEEVKQQCERFIGFKLNEDGSVSDERVSNSNNNSSLYIDIYKNFYELAINDGLTYDTESNKFSANEDDFTSCDQMTINKVLGLFANSVYDPMSKAVAKGRSSGMRIIYKPIKRNDNTIEIQVLYVGPPFHDGNKIDVSLYKSILNEEIKK